MSGALGLFLTCVVIIGVPGPSVLFIIGQALARGRARGIVSVVGNTLGMVVLAVVFAAGVSELIAREPRGADVIRWVGAVVLVVIGAFYLRGSAGEPDREPAGEPDREQAGEAVGPTPVGAEDSYGLRGGTEGTCAREPATRTRTLPVDRTGLGQSFAVGLTNPKGMVMFGVIVPSYATGGTSARGLLALSAIPLLVGLVLDSAWVLLAAWARSWLMGQGSTALRWLERCGGVMILALAVQLVVAG